MSRLETDLSVSPYFDDSDFAISKNYHRILFKPSAAVQTRELNQLQSLIQEQISRFGDYTFKDGSIVDGCGITYIPSYPIVYLENQFNSNTQLVATDINSSYLLVSNTGVRAVATHAENGYKLNYPNTNRFYLNYISTGTSGNTDVAVFQSGETISIYKPEQEKFGTLVANNILDSINILSSNSTANATGVSYGVYVSDGIIYQKGNFIKVDAQTIPVRNYDQSVNGYVIGFNTEENIIKYTADNSLLSNANGAPNETGPGADRLKLTPKLVSKQKSDVANNTNFFSIIEFDANTPTQQASGESSLNKILDVFATRTAEESGTYYVKKFSIDTYANTANSQVFDYEISPGIMYVNGYRVEKLNTFLLTTNRAINTQEAQNQIVTANFGKYVYVNELAGTFDYDAIDEVVIYDQAQKSLSDYEGSGTAPTGNVVGYANILDITYESGTKGSGSDLYRLYLVNIRMNSGKSFSDDAKSFYATSSYGNAKADIVLQSSKAVLNNATNNSLVFPFGNSALKRLRNSSGVNDTSFVFRDLTSATMSANGVATFTINAPYNGGSEALDYSPGVLSSALGNQFNIKTSNSLYTANLAGTLAIVSGNTDVIGTSTTFTSDFSVGDYIRISGSTVRKIAAIANNTKLTLDTSISTANAAANYQKLYQAGATIDVYKKGSITIVSNTQFTVNTGLGTIASGTQTLYAEYNVFRNTAVEAKKNILKNNFVKIDCSNNISGTTGPWDLGFVDIAKIRNVYVGTTYNTTNPNRVDWFTFDNGQTDELYDHGKLILKTAYKNNITSSTKMLIELDYFTANTVGGVGFFSVDSYPIDDANTANTNAITTSEIPRFNSTVYNSFVNLRDAVDFRPRRFNTANSANSSTATINPAVSNTSFDISATGSYIIAPDTNFLADIEYYLPRIDLITVNDTGDFSVKNGVSSLNPVAPSIDKDVAIVSKVYVKPYPSLTTEEAENYNRIDLLTTFVDSSTPVYTMSDIKKIDDRIARLEYYVTLNMLEQKAKDTVITDSNGLDRFKNGIFADNFNDAGLAKTSDIEFAASFDTDNGILRPKFKVNSVDFQYDANSSSGVTRTGTLVTLPYTSSMFINQRFATAVRNCSGSVWKWNGICTLFPSYDYYNASVVLPNVSVTQDLTDPNASSATIFGAWRTDSASMQNLNNLRNEVGLVTHSSQVVTTLTPSTKTSTTVLSNGINITSANVYMRSRIVGFIVTGMKPNTTMNIFFDNTKVNAYCAPGKLSGLTRFVEGKENEIITQTGAYGSTIKSDSNGNVYGLFKIPASTFKTGDRQFVVTDITDIYKQDNVLTLASTIYDATSTTTTSGGATELTTKTTIYSTSQYTNTQTTISNVQGGWFDPIAQSFTMSIPDMSVSGGYITKLGVYFSTKDKNLGIDVMIVKSTVGYPDTSLIYGKASLEASDILVSSDASLETVFTFDNPIYLSKDTEYAFIIKPRGNSPEYNIWISKTGDYDVKTNEQVYTDPYTGTLFVSANMQAWTAIQAENIKFNMYRANFSTSPGTVILNNEDDEYLQISGMTKANTNLNVETGDTIIKLVSNTRVSNTSNVDYAFGIVQSYDVANDYLLIDSSNGNLSANDTIEIHRSPTPSNSASYNANTLIATTTIKNILNEQYSVVVPNLSIVTPMYTSVDISYKGIDTNYSLDGSYKNVTNQYDSEFVDKVRMIASKSNEIDNNSGNKSAFFKATLGTSSPYVSPILDLRQKQINFVENIINNDSTGEATRYGNAKARYVSRNITLDTNLGSAEDLRCYLGAWRPNYTDIKVYVKLLGQDDIETFDSKLWTELSMTSASAAVYSSTNILDDYHEYEFRMPTSVKYTSGLQTTAYLDANGISTYARSDGALVKGFITYCFKIVLLADSSAVAPKLTDFRSIALLA